jgi:excisionase family DNA binding protein
LEKKMQRKPRQTGTAGGRTVPVVPQATATEILTVQETAALLKLPPSSIYEWTRFRGGNRGIPLPHRKVGKYLRFLRSEVMAWLLALPQSNHTRKRKYSRKNQAA